MVADLRKDVTLDLELFSISQNNKPVARCLVRLVQRGGPADCVHHVADLFQDWLKQQDLHVRNPHEAEDMIKALMIGLEPRLEQPTRVSRDGVYH